MHEYDEQTEDLADEIFRYARARTRLDPIPLNHPRTEEELRELCGATVTPEGIGGSRALQLFSEVLEPACLSVDYTKYLLEHSSELLLWIWLYHISPGNLRLSQKFLLYR